MVIFTVVFLNNPEVEPDNKVDRGEGDGKKTFSLDIMIDGVHASCGVSTLLLLLLVVPLSPPPPPRGRSDDGEA